MENKELHDYITDNLSSVIKGFATVNRSISNIEQAIWDQGNVGKRLTRDEFHNQLVADIVNTCCGC